MGQVYKYSGIVEEIGSVVRFDSGFTKRRLVVGNGLDSPSKYPNPVMFVFKKDSCSKLDGLSKGDQVVVTFVVDGRKWDGPKGTQYFVDLTGIKIEKVGEIVKKEAAPSCSDDRDTIVYGQDEVDDELPF